MSTSKTSTSPAQTKTFYERVEEFKLWNDDQTFKSHEYERRRIEKIQKKGALKVDKPLRRARSLYVPSAVCVVLGTAILLYSTINASEQENPPLLRNQVVLKTFGGVTAGLGLLAVMATAAYTYHREDKVRRSNGYPTLFESSRVKGGGSMFGVRHQENMAAINEFRDRRQTSVSEDWSKQQEVGAVEVTEPWIFLMSPKEDESFSSVRSAATLKWLDKHGAFFYNPSSQLKRQRSDSALDQSFARSSVYTSQQSCTAGTDSTDNKAGLKDKQYPVVREIHSIQPNLLDKEEIQSTNSKMVIPVGQSRNKASNPVIKIDHYIERNKSHCVHNTSHKKANWTNKTINCVGNPGVSISSTDSSGYASTSSDYYYVIDRDRRDRSSQEKVGLDKLNHSHLVPPHIGSTVGVGKTGLDRDIQPTLSEEHCQLHTQHNNVHKQGQTGVGLNNKSKVEGHLASTVAVHNVWNSEENDGESLSPPVSPDISSLPYLATNIFSKKPTPKKV